MLLLVASTVTARTPPRPGGPPQDARTCSLKGLYREMDMRFWLEKAEAEVRELC